MDLRYDVVDVFTQTPLEGNPLAVFTGAGELDSGTMQAIARELNLAETAFLLPATRGDCAIRVRIFTPAREMRFAGHPTVGSAYVARKHGLVANDAGEFALEENVGPVRVRVDGRGAIWLTTPPIAKSTIFDRAVCARAIGLRDDDLLPNVPCQIYSAGNPNLYITVRDKAAVDRAAADPAALRTLFANESEPLCTFVFTPTAEGAYSRMFAPELGVVEDPATGSATGPLAAFMMEHELAPHAHNTRFVSEQGTKMRRRSLLHVLVRGEYGRDGIDVGGYVTPIIEATMKLPRDRD
ncbi:MAG: PhzF family phenazine biosynthesis protein [Vulcanimicrobiaceae bacterium]